MQCARICDAGSRVDREMLLGLLQLAIPLQYARHIINLHICRHFCYSVKDPGQELGQIQGKYVDTNSGSPRKRNSQAEVGNPSEQATRVLPVVSISFTDQPCQCNIQLTVTLLREKNLMATSLMGISGFIEAMAASQQHPCTKDCIERL